MTITQLYVDGTALRLGSRIGKGGEGEVYALADGSQRALKYYTAHDGASREAKIAAIVRMRLADKSPLVAFPTAVARDRTGRFVGFVMNLVRGHQPLHELYSPGARKQNFPQASYAFLVRSALNSSKAIASVHAAGCVIGDINHSGILFSKQATAALIDADSFQVIEGGARYLCRVGVPEYTPPELQGKSLASVVRTPNHDAFGLAVVIFQLLTMGRHPFVGSYAKGDMPLEKAIAEIRFAYSLRRAVGMTPPPGACTLKDFPQPIADAFEASFSSEGQRSRPSAAEWSTLLADAEKKLAKCSSNDLHHYFSTATECPWCRMEKRLGIVLFVPSYVDISALPQIDLTGSSLTQLWAQIDAIRIPQRDQIKPMVASSVVNVSPEALKAANNTLKPNLIRIGGIFLGLALFFAVPAVWFIAAGIVWVSFALANKHHEDRISQFRQPLGRIDHEIQGAFEQWERRLGLDRVEDLTASLKELRQAVQQLKPDADARIAQYQRDRQSHQRRQHLDGFRIRDYKIRGVGPAKLATLASYGVETAGDFTRDSILTVPGFGPTNSQSLLNWQNECARSFVYNMQPTAADQVEIGKVHAESAQRAHQLRELCTKTAGEYLQAAQVCRLMINAPDPLLASLYQRRSQLEADCRHLGIAVPPPPAYRPKPPVSRPRALTQPSPFPVRTTTSPVPRQHTPSCPTCGSSMRRRTARRGLRSGRAFWGCSRYPSCRGTRPI